MNPLILIIAAVVWYLVLEFVRGRKETPNNVSFVFSIAASVGAFLLVLIAVVSYISSR